MLGSDTGASSPPEDRMSRERHFVLAHQTPLRCILPVFCQIPSLLFLKEAHPQNVPAPQFCLEVATHVPLPYTSHQFPLPPVLDLLDRDIPLVYYQCGSPGTNFGGQVRLE